jgi:hypothetical protein
LLTVFGVALFALLVPHILRLRAAVAQIWDWVAGTVRKACCFTGMWLACITSQDRFGWTSTIVVPGKYSKHSCVSQGSRLLVWQNANWPVWLLAAAGVIALAVSSLHLVANGKCM